VKSVFQTFALPRHAQGRARHHQNPARFDFFG